MSDVVLDALRKGPWREPAHAWLYEVKNRTGIGGQERFADALVVSCYPSRGIWIAGVEVKIARSDWRRELDDPQKAGAFFRWCDYFWIAATPGVVLESEVPETWGFVEVTGSKVKVVKKAPKLSPEPLNASFVASVLRNVSATGQERYDIGWRAGRQAAEAELGAENLRLLKTRIDELEHQLRMAEARAMPNDAHRDNVTLFERAAGINEGTIGAQTWDKHRVVRAGKAHALALMLSEDGQRVMEMRDRLRHAASSLDEILAPRPIEATHDGE